MIDLDEVKQPNGEVVLSGKAYSIRPITVDEYVEVLRVFDAIGAEKNLSKQQALVVKMITLMGPGLPEKLLATLTKPQAEALIAYLKEYQLGIKPTADEGSDTKKADGGAGEIMN